MGQIRVNLVQERIQLARRTQKSVSHSKLTIKAIKVSSIHLPPTLASYALPAASAEPQCTCTTVGTSGEISYSCDCMVGLELSET